MRPSQVCAGVFAVCLTASAMSAEEPPTRFLAGTYYTCDMATETRADEIYKESIAPVVQKLVDGGQLVGSGYARHWFGGEWRRLEYILADSLSGLVKARQSIIDEMTEAQKKAGDEFSAICPSHDDYIWTSVASSQAGAAVGRDRAKVAMSTYFVCGSREPEADAIVKTAFAPVMNAHVEEGKIISWNWVQHLVGGKYRRLLVIDGTDHASVLEYWRSFSQALDEAHPELAERFTEICPSHTDYVWDMGVD